MKITDLTQKNKEQELKVGQIWKDTSRNGENKPYILAKIQGKFCLVGLDGENSYNGLCLRIQDVFCDDFDDFVLVEDTELILK